ncbi:hypothetical protein E1A91_A13G047800v1 [Gossypium mustelinum]|uniref:RING-type domain-containing protein n=1 Tax=Gossypium mustelinum TaxID=34275 RepID=A0A5D2WE22_GOSMU|nr:hypothetical protein E1A91_A13G047800v1 [Gossypium mustelinum]
MTSASELFYTRRSRVGRPDPDSGIGSSIERNYHRRNHLSHHNQRHDLDGGDSLRRSPTLACYERRKGVNWKIVYLMVKLQSNKERSSVRFDEGTSELVSSNGLNAVGVSNARRQSLRSSERLAREGLMKSKAVERLRGVSVSANRRSNRAPPNASHREHVTRDDFRIISELSTGLAARGSPLTSEAERFELRLWDRLPLEIFRSQDINVERKTSRESRDCSICLESFGEGDVLTQLPCGHRFHFACLDPWLRTCGDCPYCRSIL